MAASVAFSHVGIFVTDLRRMEEFYSRFFGFPVIDRGMLGDRELVFFSNSPRDHHQVVLVSGRPREDSFNVVHQISFRLDGLKALKAMHARLKREPVSDIQPVSHGNALSVYFRDPEGNRLELFIDTPWYVTQPMRIPMDMSLPEKRIWKWAEETARKMPGFRSVGKWRAEVRKKIDLAARRRTGRRAAAKS